MKEPQNKLIKYQNPKYLGTFNNLDNLAKVKLYKKELFAKSGIYSFINLIDGKQYIGSAVNFYSRLIEHLKGQKSNPHLQNAMNKYGKENFIFVIYEYTPYVLPDILELEDKYINNFLFENLYNILKFATSSLGFNHSELTRSNMSINRSGKPMSASTRLSMAARHSYPISLYDNNKVYILTFANKSKLAEFLGCTRFTVRTYLNSGNLFRDKYYLISDVLFTSSSDSDSDSNSDYS